MNFSKFWFWGAQSSHSVMSNFLWPHGFQHARHAYQSPISRACLNSCPSSRWCHPTISSSVMPFSCLKSVPASGSFPVNQFFTSVSQSIGASASASVLPMNIQDWLPLRFIHLGPKQWWKHLKTLANRFFILIKCLSYINSKKFRNKQTWQWTWVIMNWPV